MGLRDRLNSYVTGRSGAGDYFWPFANIGGMPYPINLNYSLPSGKQEDIDQTFAGYVGGAYKSNGVVFACMLVRMLLFSEARFQFQAFTRGRPSGLFANPSLDVLEHPWPGATTGDLLGRAIQDVDLGGNFFATRTGSRIIRLRPDWVSIVLSGESYDYDAEVVGYLYTPGGTQSGEKPIPLLREQVAHFAPIPDPTARYRGMSWLTPIVREIMADSAARDHKLTFFENGATPNMVVKITATPERFPEVVKKFRDAEPKGYSSYKTLFLDQGTDATVVGANMRQLDFKVTQGAGETRIAAAAGVPPVIVGLSEGLQAATYSNYGQARRRFADGTMRPLWRNFAGSLETLVPPPSGSRLWYDDRDIQFLAEDKKDLAEVHQLEAQQIRTLTDAGFTPESVTGAVTSGDFTKLVHTGLFSVQLQPPGTVAPPEIPATNGTTPLAIAKG